MLVQHEDDRRAQELYRYFNPSNPAAQALNTYPDAGDVQASWSHSVDEVKSPNTTLTAFAQLAAIKLNAQRAMISVISRDNQYFIAEATRTLNISNCGEYENPDDHLWAGCQCVDKAGRLCEKTISLGPSATGEAPFFTVNDLSQDSSFKELPFVSGPPHFRYYCGTPLTTKKGINIGSFFILDVAPRDDLTKAQKGVMATLATLVMDYLEISRQASDGRRASRLSRALNCFTEGHSSLSDFPSPTPFPENPDVSQEELQIQERSTGKEFQAAAQDLPTKSSPQSPRTTATLDTLETRSSTVGENPGPDLYGPSQIQPAYESNNSGDASSHSWVFKRAANLLRESLDIGGDGGVIFLDAKSDPSDMMDAVSGRDDIDRPAITLALSTVDEPFAAPTARNSPLDITRFGQKFLTKLMRRYPKGRLWSFHSDGSPFTSDDNRSDLASVFPETSKTSKRVSRNRKQKEARLLRQYIPNASQIMFVPLWNAAEANWAAGCLCWNANETNVFSSALELSSILGFGTSVMSEISHIDSVIADKQKADFIGSVSHELRSPLHGILAAAEFLSDTDPSRVQASLIETINSCGRTLLDTISHVLDFSKINTFDQSLHSAHDLRVGNGDEKLALSSNSASPLPSLFAVLDMAAICEEVVEGVCIGRSFTDITSLDIMDPTNRTLHVDHNGISNSTGASSTTQKIDIIVDIASGNWMRTTQPGAVRRLIMNLFGNALKYTDRGSVTVRLDIGRTDQVNATEQKNTDWVTLSIIDTGKGISEDFLRSRLFTPFSQENVLAPGTGLGLSIVHSIVKMMKGHITIRSRVGEGTVVKVALPLAQSGNITKGTESPLVASVGEELKIARSLKDDLAGKKVAIFDFNPATLSHDTATHKDQIMARYLTEWFGMDIQPWSPHVQADVVIVKEEDLPRLQQSCSERTFPSITVLRGGTVSHTKDSTRVTAPGQIVETLSKPYGPYKLAGGLKICLTKTKAMNVQPEVPTGSGSSTSEEFGPVTPPEAYNVTMAVSSKSVMAEPSGVELMLKTTDNVTITEVRKKQDKNDHTILVPVGASEVVSLSPVEEPKATAPLTLRQVHEQRPSLAKSAKKAPVNGTSSTIPPDGLKILIVDDNQINLKLLHTFLKRRKPQILDSAENGRIAVEAVEQNPYSYDIIFMDLSMPVMNGFEATRAIRAFEKENQERYLPSAYTQEKEVTTATHEKDDPLQSAMQTNRSVPATSLLSPATIIALTGLAAGRDVTEAFAAGVDLFLTKPVPFKEVSKIVDEWIAKRDAAEPKEAK